MKVLLVIFVLLLFLLATIRYFIFFHDKKIEIKSRRVLEQIPLISDNIDYYDFIAISKKVSVSNSVVRTHGDFFDFILNTVKIEENPDCIENRLSSINYEEVFYE